MVPHQHDRPYLPAAGHDHFLRLYDPITRLFGFQRALGRLIAQAGLAPGHRVLDIGCGTGTLLVSVGRQLQGLSLVGIDPDPNALAIATQKAARAKVAVRFDRAFGDALPFGDASFDRVFSSMMFHHLPREARLPVLREVRRVLAPGGRLEFLDFAGRHGGFLARLVHGRHMSAGEDRLTPRILEAGFATAERVGVQQTAFGPIAFYQATVA